MILGGKDESILENVNIFMSSLTPRAFNRQWEDYAPEGEQVELYEIKRSIREKRVDFINNSLSISKMMENERI